MSPVPFTLPLFALAGAACIALLWFFRRTPEGRSPAANVTALGALLAAVLALIAWPEERAQVRGFDGFLLGDDLGCLVTVLASLAAAVTAWMLPPYLLKAGRDRAEIYALLLLAVAGMSVMAMTDHLATFFVGLETMSVALYALSASLRERTASVEAGLKYFLTGAFASGILVFGLALLYGATGSFALAEIAVRLQQSGELALAGLLLVIVGFGFKLAAAPFHMWAPDVYEGAPTPITGFMSTTVKLAAFAALMRVVKAAGLFHDPVSDALAWIGALTITAGNLGALAQSSVKRMLAYSSISHAGYMLLGVVALAAAPKDNPGLAQASSAAVLFYLVTYTLMNLGAFAVLAAVESSDGRGLGFAELGGLKSRHPWLAGCMLLFMLSLAGVPPTGGFLAKWRIFEVLVDHYQTAPGSSSSPSWP